ncbi:MAG: carbohydrate ABC transporter permease [Lachnospiraceae bacterium]
MKRKGSLQDRIFNVINYSIMMVLVIITFYPLLYVLFASLSDPKLLMAHQGLLFKPLGKMTLKGYEITFQNPSILIGYRNTIFYVVVGTAVNLVLTSLGAYVLSKKHFLLRKFLMKVIVISMFFHGGIIPMFFVIKGLGMYDTPWSIILPTAINAYNLIIMRTFFENIPASLEEAAVIDGATDFDIFIRVVLPLSKPVIAVMVLYYGVSHWNSWFNAMIYLRDRDIFPLQLFLREILLTSNSATAAVDTTQMMEESFYKELIRYCTIVVSTVPILCIYPFLQKYFVKGVMIGAVKE